MKQNPKNQSKKLNGSNKRSAGKSFPPPLLSSIRFTHTFRFLSTSASAGVGQPVTFPNMIDMLNVAATATTAFQLPERIRLRKVEMWSSPTTATTPTTVDIEFSGNANGQVGPGGIFSDVSMGTTRPAHVLARPPKDSAAYLWQSSASTAQAFLMHFPINTVVDVTVEFVLYDRATGGTNATAAAPVGATPGQLYVRGLDGLATGATILPPVSYISD